MDKFSNVIRRIREVIFKINLEEPFVIDFIYSFTNIVTDSDYIETAAVDNKSRIIYNANFVNSLNDSELEFVILHEITHILRLHPYRAKEYVNSREKIYHVSKDKLNEIYNIVADAFVNYDVAHNYFNRREYIKGVVTFDFLINKFGLDRNLIFPSSSNMPSEEAICDMILDNVLKNQNNIEDLINELSKDLKNSKNVLSKDIKNSKDVDKSISGKSEEFNKGYEVDNKNVKNIVKDLVDKSVGAGNMPAGLYRSIHDILYVGVDYITLLDSVLSSSISLDTYKNIRKPSRRFSYLPGYSLERKPEVYTLVDTSGSISDADLSRFISEIYSISLTKGTNIHIYFWDAKSYGDVLITNPDDIFNKLKDKIQGGGGTDPTDALIKVVESHPYPYSDILIIFTDGDWQYGENYNYAIDLVKSNFDKKILVTVKNIPRGIEGFVIIKRTI